MGALAAAYLSALVAFVVIDGVWLSTMASRLYRPILGDILAPAVSFAPAIAFYLLYPVGVIVFAVLPAVKSGGLAAAVISGALFGFFAYATYDLTNHATLRHWVWQITLLDIAWGTVLTALVAAAGYGAAIRFGAAGVQ